MKAKKHLRRIQASLDSAADRGADRLDTIEAKIDQWRAGAIPTTSRRYATIDLKLDKILREFERRKLPEDLYVDVSHRLEKIDVALKEHTDQDLSLNEVFEKLGQKLTIILGGIDALHIERGRVLQGAPFTMDNIKKVEDALAESVERDEEAEHSVKAALAGKTTVLREIANAEDHVRGAAVAAVCRLNYTDHLDRAREALKGV